MVLEESKILEDKKERNREMENLFQEELLIDFSWSPHRIICVDCHLEFDYDFLFKRSTKLTIACVKCEAFVCSTCQETKPKRLLCEICGGFLCQRCATSSLELVDSPKKLGIPCVQLKKMSCHVLSKTCRLCSKSFCALCHFRVACPQCKSV